VGIAFLWSPILILLPMEKTRVASADSGPHQPCVSVLSCIRRYIISAQGAHRGFSIFVWFHQMILEEALWSFTSLAGVFPQITHDSLAGLIASEDMQKGYCQEESIEMIGPVKL